MSDFTCPECNGTGVYQGLNTVEPCRACGGLKGGIFVPPDIANALCDAARENRAIYGKPITSHEIRERFAEAEILYGNPDAESPGGAIGKSVIEYAAEQAGIEIPIALTFSLDEQSSFGVSCFYDFGTVETNHGPMQVRPDETVTTLTLLRVPHKQEYYQRYQLYYRLIKNQEPFKATITDQFGGKVTETMVLKSVDPDGWFCDIVLEMRTVHA